MTSARYLSRFHSIADFRRAARRALPKMVFDFADGGSESESTLRENLDAIERLRLLPYGLVNVGKRSQSVKLFGKAAASPIIIGPTGLASAFWPKGDVALAKAARRAGIPFVMSTNANSTLEEVAAANGERKWFQLYMRPNRDETAALIDRVRAAGFEALQITIDTAVPSRRLRDLRNGFSAPFRWTPANALSAALRPSWLVRMARHGAPRPAVIEDHAPVGQTPQSLAQTVSQILNPTTGWDDVAWMRDYWKGPLMLKGLSDPRQAERAAALGLDGVVVSNHGGRQLDGAVASIDALPEIVAVAADRLTVLVDGGFRKGVDILKALALGASAVQIGRATLYALAVAGEEGVVHALDLLKAEIDVGQALLGLPEVAAINADSLWNPPRPPFGRRPTVDRLDVLKRPSAT